MKRPFITTLAMILAALVLGGAAPMATATPETSPTPTEVVGSADDQLGPIYTTAKLPAGRTDPVILTVKGTWPGSRLMAGVVLTSTQENLVELFEMGDQFERDKVIRVPAPTGGWAARRQYRWWVTEIDHDLQNNGEFTTPAWSRRSETTRPSETPRPVPTTRPGETQGGLSNTGV